MNTLRAERAEIHAKALREKQGPTTNHTRFVDQLHNNGIEVAKVSFIAWLLAYLQDNLLSKSSWLHVRDHGLSLERLYETWLQTCPIIDGERVLDK